MFLAFCSSGPVQKYKASSSQRANRGVMCGRPSGRTVVTQNSSAPSSRFRASDHGVAVAPLSPYRGSSSVTGSLPAKALSFRFVTE